MKQYDTHNLMYTIMTIDSACQSPQISWYGQWMGSHMYWLCGHNCDHTVSTCKRI